MTQMMRLIFCSVCLVSVFSLSGCATTNKQAAQHPHLHQGNQYARDGLYREAIREYEEALKNPLKVNAARRNMGMVYVKMGEFAKAETELKKAITHYQNNFECNFYLGEALRAQEKYADAIYHYQKADRLRHNDVKNLKSLAWSYFKIRYYSEALTVVRRVIKARAGDEQANIILARTLLKLKQPDKALIVIKKAQKKADKQLFAYFKSVEGDILFDLDKVPEAAEAYRAAMKRQPLLAGALLGLGRCELHKGNTTEAIKFMERAARLKPTMAQTQYFLAKAYEGVDKDKSLNHYRKFGRLAAADPEFLTQITEVKQRISMLKK